MGADNPSFGGGEPRSYYYLDLGSSNPEGAESVLLRAKLQDPMRHGEEVPLSTLEQAWKARFKFFPASRLPEGTSHAAQDFVEQHPNFLVLAVSKDVIRQVYGMIPSLESSGAMRPSGLLRPEHERHWVAEKKPSQDT